jgi:ABC-type protease/lipase transport system fused ATPase/permease subunit
MKAGQVTLVIVTHRSTLLSAMDRILLLREGAIHRFGPPSEVLRVERPRGPEGQPAVIAGQIMPKG